jgi:hypothetical protein
MTESMTIRPSPYDYKKRLRIGASSKRQSISPSPSLAPAPVRETRFRTVNRTTPPLRERLSPEESAGAAAQLIREIGTLPEADLRSRAIDILKAKNRLSVDDAKRVETAFAAGMALPDASLETLPIDESAPTGREMPQLPSASAEAITPRRRRGRRM